MPAGRPTLLTPEVLEDVRRLLPTVLYLETVGDYLGLSRETWRVWLRRGRKEHTRLAKDRRAKPKASEAIYLEFFVTYKKALAEGELYDAGIIKRASADQVGPDGTLLRKGEWQAAAWRLERRFQGRWSSFRKELAALRRQVELLEKSLGERGSDSESPGPSSAPGGAPAPAGDPG